MDVQAGKIQEGRRWKQLRFGQKGNGRKQKGDGKKPMVNEKQKGDGKQFQVGGRWLEEEGHCFPKKDKCQVSVSADPFYRLFPTASGLSAPFQPSYY